jgi:hypothetical protein
MLILDLYLTRMCLIFIKNFVALMWPFNRKNVSVMKAINCRQVQKYFQVLQVFFVGLSVFHNIAY